MGKDAVVMSSKHPLLHNIKGIFIKDGVACTCFLEPEVSIFESAGGVLTYQLMLPSLAIQLL